ncbi:MAG TPA: response regulator [Caulobacteraceae bacterium]|nr:response regulator [Caulobacteraceae bacterium]
MSKTVLSVDDSASVRQMVRLTLSGAGYQVIEAGDGREGLAKARGGGVDVVVTDINMPNMTGLELVEALRQLPAFNGVPILCLTTESDPGIKGRARAAGASGWITKPFQPDQLLAAVRKVLGA